MPNEFATAAILNPRIKMMRQRRLSGCCPFRPLGDVLDSITKAAQILTAVAGISMNIYGTLTSAQIAKEAQKLARDSYNAQAAIAMEKLAALKAQAEQQQAQVATSTGGIDQQTILLVAVGGLALFLALR